MNAHAIDERTKERLEEGIGLLSELARAGLPPALEQNVEKVLGLTHLLVYRSRTGSGLPLIGILGSASSGKSTLFNSIAQADIAKVTPIPHQTTGPILAAPGEMEHLAGDPSFLRPVVGRVDWAAAGTLGLSGAPDAAVVVGAWPRGENAFILVDLPDVGTVDSRQDRLVALRMLPWLDRVILLVTEESFAQAEHDTIAQWLGSIHPERARPELFVVLNRRHQKTTDPEFKSRLEHLRGFWTDATLTTLPHLVDTPRFRREATAVLVAEANTRTSAMVHKALANLALRLQMEVADLQRTRAQVRHALEGAMEREVRSACRLRKTLFSEAFNKNLDRFSPWRTSLGRIRAFMGGQREPPPMAELLSEPAVQRHVSRTIEELRRTMARTLERFADLPAHRPSAAPSPPETHGYEEAVARLVATTNERAREDVESLLADLQEQRTVKDPLWGMVTGVASTMFLLDLVLPSVGTLSSLAVSGALSALGLGGMITSDILRKLRTSKVRGLFEEGLAEILGDAARRMLTDDRLVRLDIAPLSRRLSRWTREFAEVS